MQRHLSVLTAALPRLVEAGEAAVVFGVTEDGLDDAVERLAVLGGRDAAHEVIDAAGPAGRGVSNRRWVASPALTVRRRAARLRW
jgi:hypothetical protein